MNKVLTRAVLLGGLLAGVFVLSALAEEFPFRSAVIGSNPNTVIGGVPSAGGPWTVHRGSAALTGDGRLRVEIAGLASLVCGGTGGSYPSANLRVSGPRPGIVLVHSRQMGVRPNLPLVHSSDDEQIRRFR